MKKLQIISFTEKEVHQTTIRYRFQNSPFGTVLIASTSLGVCYTAPAPDKENALALLKQAFKGVNIEHGTSYLGITVSEFEFKENKEPVSYHLLGTPFQLDVWRELLSIPFGQTNTYGQLANAIGRPKACRAVGSAVGSNPVFFWIPCHRVLPASGKIGNYLWGSNMKQEILDWERQQRLVIQ